MLLKLGRWLYNPSSTLKPALLQVPRQFHGVCCLVAVKPGDTGRYRRISQEPEKKNRKAHDNSTIICAKLKFFYLCDGYDLEIRITIWWVCERIIIEHCTWCVFSPKKVCVLVFFHCNWCFRPKEMSWIFQSNDVASPSGIVSESPRASESLLGGNALAEHGKGMARHFEVMGCGRGSPCGHRQWGNHLENIQPYITQKKSPRLEYVGVQMIYHQSGNIHLNHSPSGLTLFPWRSKVTQGTLQRSPPISGLIFNSYWPPSTPSTGSSLPLGGGRYP